ncbi:MAG TPA: S8 family serine peptidase, partial [Bacteroidia bacterium]|nr:S8 family serine peptidase [Bacteroidia bacterium]
QVDVCAPGVKIVTTKNISDGQYTDSFSGTSAATPHVAGVAALILSVNPELTASEVENIIKTTTDSLGMIVPNPQTGYGRVNAFEAVQSAMKTLEGKNGSGTV